MNIDKDIPENILKTDVDSNNSSVSYQNLNTSNISLKDKTDTNKNNKTNNNCNNNILNKTSIEDIIQDNSKYRQQNSQPSEEIQLPLTSDISNKVKEIDIINKSNSIIRPPSPLLNRYTLKNTTTSMATRLPPSNNYHRNIITPESLSESYSLNSGMERNASKPSKSRISTGTRTTTTIITQPSNVNNSNVVIVPFSPTTNSASNSSVDSSSPYTPKTPSSSFTSNSKAIASPSLTNATAIGTSIDRTKLLHEDSYKKKIFSIKGNQTQCVIPELVPQSPDQKNVAPELGKMYVFIIRVNCQQKLYNPYVTVYLGDQQYNTCVSGMQEGLWNEGFMFDVSIHTQYFGILSFYLYNGNICLPDRFIGKCEIRIESLKNMPEMFDSWYELLDKNNRSPGAINIRIFYAYQDFHIPIKDESIEDLLLKAENDEGDDITDRSVKSRDIQSRGISRMGTVNEKEFAKFEHEFMSSLTKAPKSWYESIGKVFVSDEMFNVLKMIRRSLYTLGQGLNISPTQLLEGVLVLEKYYQKREQPFNEIRNSDKVIRNLSMIEKTRDLFRYSLAAYGWIGLNYVGKGKGMIFDSMKKDSSIAAIVNFLCILKDDILLYNFQPSKVFDQVYFIAYDRRYDAIVLSIRGTLNVKDTLADLVCEYVRWNGGLVHSGVLSSAIYFYKKLFEKLKEYVREKKPKYLYLTGHSLGAGIASVLTIMLKNVENEFEAPQGFKIECYCFAPPSVLNIELSKVYEDCIFSYVNNNDIVPRLSYGSLMDLHEMVCTVNSTDKEKEISLIKLLSSDSKAEEFIEKKLDEFEKCRNNLRIKTTFNTLNLKLCPPGKAYIITNNPEKQDDVILREVELEELTEILVRKSMFIDHSFKEYLENLNYLFESTLLNRLNNNMKVTYSPRMINDDSSTSISVVSSVTVKTDISPVEEKEKEVKNVLVEEESIINNDKSVAEKNHDNPVETTKSVIKREETSKLIQTETIDNSSSSSLNKIKSIATVSTSNVNISVSNDIELNNDPTHIGENDTSALTDNIIDDNSLVNNSDSLILDINFNNDINEKSI